jgi:hypothetical protein
MDSEGNFIITWCDHYAAEYVLMARMYHADGSPASGPMRIADYGYLPAVGMAPDGRYLIAWLGDGGVFAQMFDADRAPLSDPFYVHQSGGTLLSPEIAASRNGEFLVTWQNDNQALWGGSVVLGRRLSRLGEPLGPEFVIGVGSTTNTHQAAFDD